MSNENQINIPDVSKLVNKMYKLNKSTNKYFSTEDFGKYGKDDFVEITGSKNAEVNNNLEYVVENDENTIYNLLDLCIKNDLRKRVFIEVPEDKYVHVMDFLPKENPFTKQTYKGMEESLLGNITSELDDKNKELIIELKNKIFNSLLSYFKLNLSGYADNLDVSKTFKEIRNSFNDFIRIELNDLKFIELYVKSFTANRYCTDGKTRYINGLNVFLNEFLPDKEVTHFVLDLNKKEVLVKSKIDCYNNYNIDGFIYSYYANYLKYKKCVKHDDINIYIRDEYIVESDRDKHIKAIIKAKLPELIEKELINYIKLNYSDYLKYYSVDYIVNLYNEARNLINTITFNIIKERYIFSDDLGITCINSNAETLIGAFDAAYKQFLNYKSLDNCMHKEDDFFGNNIEKSLCNITNINYNKTFYINLTSKNICLLNKSGFVNYINSFNSYLDIPETLDDANGIDKFTEQVIEIVSKKNNEGEISIAETTMGNVIKNLCFHLQSANIHVEEKLRQKVFAVVRREITSLAKIKGYLDYYSNMLAKYPDSVKFKKLKENCERQIALFERTKIKNANFNSVFQDDVIRYSEKPYILDTVFYVNENDLKFIDGEYNELLDCVITSSHSDIDLNKIDLFHPEIVGINTKDYCFETGCKVTEMKLAETYRHVKQGAIEIIVNGKTANENPLLFKDVNTNIKFYQRIGNNVIELVPNVNPEPDREEGIYIHGVQVNHTGHTLINSTNTIKPILFKYDEEGKLLSESIDKMKQFGIFLTKEEAFAYGLKEETDLLLSRDKVTISNNDVKTKITENNTKVVESENKVKISENSKTESGLKLGSNIVTVAAGLLGIVVIPFLKWLYKTITTDGIISTGLIGSSALVPPVAVPLAIGAIGASILLSKSDKEHNNTGIIKSVCNKVKNVVTSVANKVVNTCKKVFNFIKGFFS